MKKQKIVIIKMPGVETTVIDEMCNYLKMKYDNTNYTMEISNGS